MIHTLRMRNFKCFEDQTIAFGALTLLSGLNGMGKSSVLQALLLLRQSRQQGMLPGKGLLLNGELVHLGTVKDVLFEWAQEEKITFDLTATAGEFRGEYESSLKADVLAEVHPHGDDSVFDASLFGSQFHYLTAERIGPRTTYPVSNYVVVEQRQLGVQGEYTAHYLSEYGDEEVSVEALLNPHGTSHTLQHQIEAWLSVVSPGIRLELSAHKDMDLVKLNYSFGMGRQVSSAYRAGNVGFGITYTLPVLAAILSAKPGSLLLLENPEAHLHPRGQMYMGELMAQAAHNGIQIVVETHSDHVLNGMRLAVHAGKTVPEDIRLYYFGRREQSGLSSLEVVSPKMDRNGRIDRWPDGFFDEIDRSLSILLEPAQG